MLLKTMKGENTMSTHALNIKVPSYTLGEELFNAISHGIGAALSIYALILMLLRAHGGLAVACVAIFGASMILLYTISCVYHALSRNLEGKKVLRVLDHCNVYVLVLGTYLPASLLGVGGALGWALFGLTAAFTASCKSSSCIINKSRCTFSRSLSD